MHALPKVSDTTLDSTIASLRNEEDYAKNSLKDMKTNNPVLYSLLEIVTNSDKDPEYIKGFLCGATQFYTLMSRQGVSDELERVWG